MMVLIESEVFAKTSFEELLLFLWFGAGRHRVAVLDEQAEVYTRWLDALDRRIRVDWEEMVKSALKESAHNPSRHEIHVTMRESSAWRLPTPQLTVADALDFLQRPYRILVENGFSDRAFLLSICDANTRRFLEERISHEWVEVEHCGGNDHLDKRVQELRKNKSRAMRCSALFDGDALRPGEPSLKAQAIKNSCEPEVHHHQLERRAIENYLPRASLERWCKLVDDPQRKHREKQMEAFLSLRAGQRAHYNVKGGFKKDLPNAHKAGDLFNNLSEDARRLLHEGLDQDIASLYRHGYVRVHDLERSDDVTRLQSFTREIAASIR